MNTEASSNTAKCCTVVHTLPLLYYQVLIPVRKDLFVLDDLTKHIIAQENGVTSGKLTCLTSANLSYSYNPSQKISPVLRGRYTLQRIKRVFSSSSKGHWQKAWRKKKK